MKKVIIAGVDYKESLGKFVFFQGDLSSENFVSELKKQLDSFSLAGIFSIAGIGPRSEALQTSPSSLRKTFDLNFYVPTSLYLFLKSKLARRSYFCFIGSSAGISGLPRFSAYSATKSALSAYFFSVICEDSRNQVDIFGLIPSGMKTNFQQNNGVPSSPLDKYLLADPAKIASRMIYWVESQKRKSTIKHIGISSGIFLIIRNFPFKLRMAIVKRLSDGNR
jgi:short-subunit dehydrogenase